MINPHTKAWKAPKCLITLLGDRCLRRPKDAALHRTDWPRTFYSRDTKHIGCMVSPRINWIVRLAGALRALGPYAAIELLVPGGTLIALAIWVFRNRASLAARARRAGKHSVDLEPDQDVTTSAIPSAR